MDSKLLEAKLAEQAERYDGKSFFSHQPTPSPPPPPDMVSAMKKVAENLIESKKSLSVEERNLLSVAYKNVIGSRRSSWRILSSLEQKENEGEKKREAIADYRKKVEEEMEKIVKEVMDLLDKLIEGEGDKSDNTESIVFYYKM